jgi:nitrite reductase (NADH) small subunit
MTIDVDTWVCVASTADLEPDAGVAVRLGSNQVALFLVDDALYAIDNLDPFSGTNVLARGIVGDRAGEPKVASPVYKQNFSLRTGICLDDPTVSVRTWAVRSNDGFVELRVH